MKIPYPGLNSVLASKVHMYICKKSVNDLKHFVKCQTFKPYMIYGTNPVINSYIIEMSDIKRNPFNHTTIIDCDKIFTSIKCKYDLKMRTTSRTDVCDDLFQIILSKSNCALEIEIDKRELQSINCLITNI